MTAPDRIWCHPTERQPVPVKDRRNAKWVRGRWKDHDSKASGDVEYIRADLAKAQAGALVKERDEAHMLRQIDFWIRSVFVGFFMAILASAFAVAILSLFW